jgi:pimeloyl-ACP methyl ester carboxylesterase
MNGLRTGMISVSQDIALSYAEQGAADRPTLILLHGYSDSWRSYLPLMGVLSDRFRVVAVSYRGHGDSSTPTDGYDLATLSADVVGVIEALSIDRAIIVGHSMGSLIAQRIALQRPQLVEKLILIGAFATLKANAAVEALWRDEVSHFSNSVTPAFARAFQQSSLAVPIPSDFFEGIVEESLKVPAHVWKGALQTMLEDDQTDRLHEISVPTLVIWGDKDGFAGRSDQTLLTGAIRNARLEIHPGIGHAPHWEDLDAVAANIVAFVDDQSRLAA